MQTLDDLKLIIILIFVVRFFAIKIMFIAAFGRPIRRFIWPINTIGKFFLNILSKVNVVY